jgi:hypothetical protein
MAGCGAQARGRPKPGTGGVVLIGFVGLHNPGCHTHRLLHHSFKLCSSHLRQHQHQPASTTIPFKVWKSVKEYVYLSSSAHHLA